MAQTVDEFIQELQGFGEQLTNITPTLQDVGTVIVNTLKGRVPVDSGRLKNSIRSSVNGTKLEIEMLGYGFFQNYGVNGTNDNVAQPVPSYGISLRPRSEPFYAFKTRKWGLRAQNFFVIDDLQQDLTNEITNIIDNL